MNWGRMLREARLRARLTQRALAAKSGLTQSAIARIETGAIHPRVDTVDKILLACDWSLEPMPRAGTGVDRSLIAEQLDLTAAQRMQQGQAAAESLHGIVGRRRRKPR